MKTQIYLSFNIEEQDWSVLHKLLQSAERLDVVRSAPWTAPLFNSYCAIELYDHDSVLQQVHTALSEMRIKWRERRELIFTDAELKTFPLLVLRIQRAHRGWAAPRYGTEYDMSQACPHCGTGAIQTSPLRLRPSDAPKSRAIFHIVSGEILVSMTLGEAIHEAGVTGVELRTAQSHKDRRDLPWQQIIANAELPPMAPSSRGITRDKVCPQCGRDGYFNDAHEPTEIEYSSRDIDIDKLPDVVQTYERFGYSFRREPLSDSLFAGPLLLVKPKVLVVFRRLKVHAAGFEPVRIV